MKVLICVDAFKSSLSSQEAGSIISDSIASAMPAMKVRQILMADGGEGSLEALQQNGGFERHTIKVSDPLFRPVEAFYLTDGKSAYIELAQASGYQLLSKADANPMNTSTLGTGELIRDAVSEGYEKMVLFLGGSATNDAGIGIAHALGFRFLDHSGRELKPIGAHLNQIHHIHIPDTKPEIVFDILCDVANPLFGPQGAAKTYARQKGANSTEIEILEKGLQHFARVVSRQCGREVAHFPGSGAAGGIAAGLSALFETKIFKGFDLLSELLNLESAIEQADCVISGEGQLDVQTLQGKLIQGVAAICRKHRKPLFIFCGRNQLDQGHISKLGIERVYTIESIANGIDDAITNAPNYLDKLTRKWVGDYLDSTR